MFDPTIFDNLKVVLEGAIYDEDLEGHLFVTNRKDNINLAEMSREYTISFHLNKQSASICNWVLSSDIRQLHNEMTESNQFDVGCNINIEFVIKVAFDNSAISKVQKKIEKQWVGRKIEYYLSSPYPLQEKVEMKAIIKFSRVIKDEDIDDLIEMLEHIKCTLQRLETT